MSSPRSTHAKLVEREVRSADPTLSDEANRMLTEELRRAVGADRVVVPEDTPRRSRDAHGARSPALADLVTNRPLFIVGGLLAITLAAALTLTTGSWWAAAGVVGVVVLGAGVSAALALQLTTQTEHMAPETAARLEEEGVVDPDKTFTDLLEDYAGARRARGVAEIVSSGANEQRVAAIDDPAAAAIEQRTSWTPTSAPGGAAGRRSAVAGLPWWVVLGVMVVSLVGAVVEGGAVWLAPAIVVPSGFAWILVQYRMDDAAEAPGSQRRGIDRPTGDVRRGLESRIVPIIAAFVAFALALMVIAGLVLDFG